MRFMTFIKVPANQNLSDVPPSLFTAMDAFIAEHTKSGVYIDGAGLEAPKHGTRVRLSGGKISVTDGPFSEAKEIVGGYALCELPSHAEARAFAKKFMELHLEHWPAFEGECEVRALAGAPDSAPA